MKRFLIRIMVGISILLLGSCIGFPKPANSNDSLIIGNLILDFPDGFFDNPKRTIRSGVLITFINQATGAKSYVHTRDGWFHVATNGKDQYVLESYEFEEMDESSTRVRIGPVTMRKKIPNQGGNIIYLGHMAVTYRFPQTGDADPMGDAIKRSWNYIPSFAVSWETNVLDYIAEKDASGSWAEYPVTRQQEK